MHCLKYTNMCHCGSKMPSRSQQVEIRHLKTCLKCFCRYKDSKYTYSEFLISLIENLSSPVLANTPVIHNNMDILKQQAPDYYEV